MTHELDAIKRVSATGEGTISGFRTSSAGGYVISVHIPNLEQAKKVLELHEQNVEFSFVPLP